MKNTRWSPRSPALAVLAAGALALMPTAPLQGQVRPDRVGEQDCRCVDRDGKAIENCTCFRMPDVEGIVARVVPLMGRARLGITLSGAEDESRGALVESVMERGPADEAGLQEGDIITRMGGVSLLEPLPEGGEEDFSLDRSLPMQRLVALARNLDPGEEVEIGYLRDGETRTTTLTTRDLSDWSRFGLVAPGWDEEGLAVRMKALGDQMRELHVRRPEDLGVSVWTHEEDDPQWMLRTSPEGRRAIVARSGRGSLWECPGDPAAGMFMAFSNRCVGGLELLDLKPGLAEYFGASGGVLVSDVHEDSMLGLQPGDVILDIDGREVTDAAQVRRILLSYEEDEEISLRILRKESETSVRGTLRD